MPLPWHAAAPSVQGPHIPGHHPYPTLHSCSPNVTAYSPPVTKHPVANARRSTIHTLPPASHATYVEEQSVIARGYDAAQQVVEVQLYVQSMPNVSFRGIAMGCYVTSDTV